jgi:bacteriocin-like protein
MEETRQNAIEPVPTSNEDVVTPTPEITEMSEDALEQINGGTKTSITHDGTVNKTKTADKLFKQMDDYIRS